MVVIKWSYEIKGTIVKADVPLYGGLYKEDHGSIFLVQEQTLMTR